MTPGCSGTWCWWAGVGQPMPDRQRRLSALQRPTGLPVWRRRVRYPGGCRQIAREDDDEAGWRRPASAGSPATPISDQGVLLVAFNLVRQPAQVGSGGGQPIQGFGLAPRRASAHNRMIWVVWRDLAPASISPIWSFVIGCCTSACGRSTPTDPRCPPHGQASSMLAPSAFTSDSPPIPDTRGNRKHLMVDIAVIAVSRHLRVRWAYRHSSLGQNRILAGPASGPRPTAPRDCIRRLLMALLARGLSTLLPGSDL